MLAAGQPRSPLARRASKACSGTPSAEVRAVTPEDVERGRRQLRQGRTWNRDVPVILVSPRAEPVDRVRGFERGCDDFLAKPAPPVHLLRMVRHLLDGTAPDTPLPIRIDTDGRRFRSELQQLGVRVGGQAHVDRPGAQDGAARCGRGAVGPDHLAPPEPGRPAGGRHLYALDAQGRR